MRGPCSGSGPSSTFVAIALLPPLLALLVLDGSALPQQESTPAAAGPAFIQPVGNQTAAIGREAVFSCSVSNIGKYKVGWLRASDQMIISVHARTVIQNERISVKYEPGSSSGNTGSSGAYGVTGSSQGSEDSVNGTWRLYIRQLKETDRGCYMCQINTSPMKSELGCLDILVSPDIINSETSTDLSVVEGDNATLSCQATGRPTPRISWKREGGQPIILSKPQTHGSAHSTSTSMFSNSSKLQFYQVSRRQMGTYFCIASNDVPPAVSKRVTLSVNFSPNVQAPTQLLGAPLGTDVILECFVEAHPKTINYWMKKPNHMLLDGPKYSIEENRDGYKVGMRLVVKAFTEDDVGSYSCVSTNSLGKVEGTSRLYKMDGQESHRGSDHVSIVGGLAEAARGSSVGSLVSFDYRKHYCLACCVVSFLLSLFALRR